MSPRSFMVPSGTAPAVPHTRQFPQEGTLRICLHLLQQAGDQDTLPLSGGLPRWPSAGRGENRSGPRAPSGCGAAGPAGPEPRAVLLRHRQLKGRRQHRVVRQIQHLSGAHRRICQHLEPGPDLPPPEPSRSWTAAWSGDCEPDRTAPAPAVSRLPPCILLAPQGRQSLPLGPVRIGQAVQQLLRPAQLSPTDAPDRHGVGGPLPDPGIGTVDRPVVKRVDLCLPDGPLRLAAAGVQGQQPRQQPCHAVRQTVIARKFPELVLRQSERSRAATLPPLFMEPVQKFPDLLIRQVLLKKTAACSDPRPGSGPAPAAV